MRTFLTSLIALTATTGLAVVAAAPAQAAGPCSIVAPARVSISKVETEIPLSLATNCASSDTVYAAWNVTSAKGLEGFAIFGSQDTDSIPFSYGRTAPDKLGTWSIKPKHAWDSKYLDVTQNTLPTDIRVASWASLTGVRDGGDIDITISGARFSAASEKYVPWTDKVGSVQVKSRTSTTWQHLTYVKLDAKGKAFVTRPYNADYEYRVQFPSDSLIWGVWTTAKRF